MRAAVAYLLVVAGTAQLIVDAGVTGDGPPGWGWLLPGALASFGLAWLLSQFRN